MTSAPQHVPAATLQQKTICRQARASFDYELGRSFTAGIALLGTEVSTMRRRGASLDGAYVALDDAGSAWLLNAHIAAGEGRAETRHEPRRRRKLLLHAHELAVLGRGIAQDGMTAVAVELFFDVRGRAKVTLALAKGKNSADKRHAIRDRDWARDRRNLTRAR